MNNCINDSVTINYIDAPRICPSDKCYIYVLIDPESEEVRYVGRTIDNLTTRLSCHCATTGYRSKFHYYNKNWIESLKKRNLKPDIKVIDIVPIDEWAEKEIYYIKLFKDNGFRLTNFSSGGKGNTRSSTKKWTKEQKENKSIALRNRKIGATLFDLNGNVIIENSNYIVISEFLGISRCLVNNSIRKKTMLNKNYYVSKDGPLSIELKRRQCKIKIININTDNYYIFGSQKEAADFLSVSVSSISISVNYSRILKNNKIERYYESLC